MKDLGLEGEADFISDCRKSLLCSPGRMDFSRQARAGLATSYCMLELVFVVFSAQWKGSSPQLGIEGLETKEGSHVSTLRSRRKQ